MGLHRAYPPPRPAATRKGGEVETVHDHRHCDKVAKAAVRSGAGPRTSSEGVRHRPAHKPPAPRRVDRSGRPAAFHESECRPVARSNTVAGPCHPAPPRPQRRGRQSRLLSASDVQTRQPAGMNSPVTSNTVAVLLSGAFLRSWAVWEFAITDAQYMHRQAARFRASTDIRCRKDPKRAWATSTGTFMIFRNPRKPRVVMPADRPMPARHRLAVARRPRSAAQTSPQRRWWAVFSAHHTVRNRQHSGQGHRWDRQDRFPLQQGWRAALDSRWVRNRRCDHVGTGSRPIPQTRAELGPAEPHIWQRQRRHSQHGRTPI